MPQSMIVELVGPAGAGKTTVGEVLTRRAGDGKARVRVTQYHACPSVWGLPRPLVTAGALRALPAMAALVRCARALPWEEMKMLIRLAALDQFLARDGDGALTVLAEGPVFALSWLRVGGHRCITDGRFDAWWHRALDHWASRLHAIVLLDAPDPLLAHRIHAREQPHRYKDRSEQEIYQFSTVFRSAFDWVLAGLAARGGPRVVALASNGVTPGELATRILTALRETTHAD